MTADTAWGADLRSFWVKRMSEEAEGFLAL